MGATRRKFTLEFKTEAAHRVIDSGRNVAEVAKELSISQEALYRWVKDERIRLEAESGVNEGPLSGKGDESS
ncbi:MAG: transposase [Actinomycetota bacterium]|nr:transposase [Actinomycetota bacterium]